MSKKLMLLAAGALSTLAFAVLPVIASAEELQVHCPTAPCIGSIASNAAEHAIRFESPGAGFEAAAVAGSVTVGPATTTTGTTELEFKEVKEKASGFNFACNSPGAAAGVIKTGPLTTHFIRLGIGFGTSPAVLLTNMKVTFSCAGGLVTRTVTGSIIGTITTPNCNNPSATNVVTFNILIALNQEHREWTGNVFSLTSGNHASDLEASAQTGRGNIEWKVNKPTLTC